MRSLLALLLWLVTTALLALSVPALWTQHNVVSVDGYSDLAAGAAGGSFGAALVLWSARHRRAATESRFKP